MSKWYESSPAWKKIGWILSGFTLFYWLLQLDHTLILLWGRTGQNWSGALLSFISLLGLLPGLYLQGRRQRLKKFTALLILSAALAVFGWCLTVELTGDIRILILNHFAFFLFLSLPVTIALFLLFMGRRAGWQYRIQGGIVMLVMVEWIPTDSSYLIFFTYFTVMFAVIAGYLAYSIIKKPDRGIFHTYVVEYHRRLNLPAHVVISSLRFTAGAVLSFYIFYYHEIWNRIFIMAGFGILAGWYVSKRIPQISFKHVFYAFPLLLVLVFTAGGYSLEIESVWKVEASAFLVFMLLAFLDRAVLGRIRTKLRYFALGFIIYSYLLPLSAGMRLNESELIWLTVFLIPLLAVQFLRLRLINRGMAIAATAVMFMFYTFGAPVNSEQMSALTYKYSDRRYSNCFIPSLGKAADSWASNNPWLSFIRNPEVSYTGDTFAESLFAHFTWPDRAWVEYIDYRQLQDDSRGSWYMELVARQTDRPVLFFTRPSAGAEKVNAPTGLKRLSFVHCDYYYNRPAAEVFNSYWKKSNLPSNLETIEDATRLAEGMAVPYTPENQAGLIEGNHFQNNLKQQVLDRLRFLLKQNSWQHLKDDVAVLRPVIEEVPGYYPFLEQYFTSIQNEAELLKILLELYNRKGGEELSLRIAAIYTRGLKYEEALFFADKISADSSHYKKAGMLKLENYINQRKYRDALQLVGRLIQLNPDDVSLQYKKEKIIERMLVEEQQDSRSYNQSLEAEREY